MLPNTADAALPIPRCPRKPHAAQCTFDSPGPQHRASWLCPLQTLHCLPIAHVDHMRPEKLGHAALVEETDVSSVG